MRNVGKFGGGSLAKILSINQIYGVIASVELGVLLLLISIPEVKEVKWINEEAGNIFTLFKEFFKSIYRKEILPPLILTLLCRICPEISESGNYIISDELGWSPLTLSLNTLASSLIYFVGMLYVVNFAENISFRNKMFIAAVSGVLANFVYYRFAMYDAIDFVPMFVLHIVHAIFQNLNFEFFIIALVARYSTYCPKGMESFCVATLIAMMNFCGIQGGQFGAKILKSYGIGKGSYEYLIYPMAITFSCSVVTLLLSPVLGK